MLIGINLFPFQRHVAFKLVLGEDVTGQQEIMVLFQLQQRLAQAAADGRDLRQFFRRQVIQVFVRRRSGVDLGLDTVKARHQQGSKGEIGVGRRIGKAGLDALGLRRFRPRNTHAARAVAGGIGAQHRCLEPRDQAFVAVGGGVGDGVQRFRVMQDAADEIQRVLAKVGVFVTRKQGLAVFPDRHVDVHARAVVALDRLRHKGHRLAIGVRHVVDHVFVFLDIVGLFDQPAKDHAQFVLVRRHLMVVFVDPHPHALHGGQHLAAQILRIIDRVDREIAALYPGTVTGVAHFVLGIGVPRGIDRVDLIGHLVDRHLIADIVKDEKLGLWPHIGSVADTGGFQVGLGLDRRAARVAGIGLVGIGFQHVAMHADGFLGIERVDIGAVGIQHQLHVGLVDRLPPGDGRAVEHEAFIEEILVDQIGDHGHMLQLAARVGEADIDIFDLLILHQFQQRGIAHICHPLG